MPYVVLRVHLRESGGKKEERKRERERERERERKREREREKERGRERERERHGGSVQLTADGNASGTGIEDDVNLLTP